MNPHQDPELQSIAANIPLHIDFAWEDAASIEQMVQALIALADWAAPEPWDKGQRQGLAGLIGYLFDNDYIDLQNDQIVYWGSAAAWNDPRTLIFGGLLCAYADHYNRVFQIQALAAQA